MVQRNPVETIHDTTSPSGIAVNDSCMVASIDQLLVTVTQTPIHPLLLVHVPIVIVVKDQRPSQRQADYKGTPNDHQVDKVSTWPFEGDR